MTSRPFTQELITILTDNLSGGIPVFGYDSNAIEVLPCVIVGVDSEQVHDGGLFGNFILEASIFIHTNGHDDANNNIAEDIHNQIFSILKAGYIISCLDGLFYEGSDIIDGEESSLIKMRFKVNTHRLD